MSDWSVVYERWRAAEQGAREALTTLGNGYFATRGAAEESHADGVHYPGTYLAGGYDRARSEIKGQLIENEDLVNWPNWLPLTFRIEGGRWFTLAEVSVLSYRRELLLDTGILLRSLRIRDAEGHISSLCSRRLVHIAQPHRAAIHWQLIPHNWSGPVTLRSSLDGHVENRGVARYRQLTGSHLSIRDVGRSPAGILYLVARSHQSGIEMAQACRHRILLNGEVVRSEGLVRADASSVGVEVSLPVHEGETVEVEKTVAVYTSRDPAISQPLQEAIDSAHASPHFEDLLRTHTQSWSRIWHRCDLDVGGLDRQARRILRLHLFHLLQVATTNIVDLDVGIPSRGLHGEAYRGHILWDELFILPSLNFRLPQLSRAVLMYRARRLDRARDAAWRAGYDGAMFPWQSGSNGREESQAIHLNPISGHWITDETHLQRHVNAAIVYNVWRYYQATHDIDFLHYHGAELILEIARFWASIAHYEPKRRRYEIHGVVGPDEYHTRYPGARRPGLRNNAYTNVMVAWVMQRALDVLEVLSQTRASELVQKLELTRKEIGRWRTISESMYVPLQTNGIINQFEGYENLKELDWHRYHSHYGDRIRLDRVLEKEGDDPNNYKAGKQADVLMLFYLFSADELRGVFESLGYPFDPHWIRLNVDYYRSRTSHGSTLSRVVHSWALSFSDTQRSFHEFSQALTSDVPTSRNDTTAEGIHLGAMAGTVDIMQRCYTGLEVRGAVLWFTPCPPKNITHLRMRLCFRGRWLQIGISRDTLTVRAEEGAGGPIQIGVIHAVYTIEPGQTRGFSLGAAGRAIMQVKQILGTSSACIPPDTTVKTAAARMRQLDTSALPVGEQNQASGIISEHDIVVGAVAPGIDPSTTPVSAIMNQQVVSCPDDIDIDEAATIMRDTHVCHLLVCNHQGAIMGLVSLSEVAMQLYRYHPAGDEISGRSPRPNRKAQERIT